MSDKVRLLFDECCLGKIAVEKLKSVVDLCGDTVELGHVLGVFPALTLDRDWIPRAAPEGWTVITCDRGKTRPSRGKLPELCRQYGVTHIIMSRSIHKRNWFGKTKALMELWDDVLEAARGPAGMRYTIRPSVHGHATLVRVELPGHSGPKRQDKLFQ